MASPVRNDRLRVSTLNFLDQLFDQSLLISLRAVADDIDASTTDLWIFLRDHSARPQQCGFFGLHSLIPADLLKLAGYDCDGNAVIARVTTNRLRQVEQTVKAQILRAFQITLSLSWTYIPEVQNVIRESFCFNKVLQQTFVIIALPRVDCVMIDVELGKLCSGLHRHDRKALPLQGSHEFQAQFALVGEHEPTAVRVAHCVSSRDQRCGPLPRGNIEPLGEWILSKWGRLGVSLG